MRPAQAGLVLRELYREASDGSPEAGFSRPEERIENPHVHHGVIDAMAERLLSPDGAAERLALKLVSVSYTHLTLPTILRV